MKRYIILLATFPVWANAQIRGTVSDNSGEPIVGAGVYWLGTTEGTTTDDEGRFTLDQPKDRRQLVVSYVGFTNDTIRISRPDETVNVVLGGSIEMNEVEVVARKVGLQKLRSSVVNQDMISSSELARAACCNLGESFTTNPSVDVSYSDAATGAKQIKLLGLSGTYVQMLTENIPNYRGAATPFALGYVPGPWMQSIQVSKGTSSVKNGYEAITGQINVEFKKPQATPSLHVNLFGDSKFKVEANVDSNIALSKRLSTGILAHYENNTTAHDENGDGFMDMPQVKQYNLQNRWAWMGDHYVFQASVKAMKEERESGQTSHMHGSSAATMPTGERYRVGIETERYEAFTKNAYIFDKEKNTNLALILAGSLHNQQSVYGHRTYDVDQKNGYASLLFETELTPAHSLSAGLSLNHDDYDQTYLLQTGRAETHLREKETVPGAYLQYTYNPNDKWVVMGGIRIDHSSRYGSFVTPRAHLRFTPNDLFHLRLSVGKGYRTNHPLAENNNLLAGSRRVVVDDNLAQEEAWNTGGSASLYLPVAGKTLTFNAEYYYTRFLHQLVVDMDSDPHAVWFTNLAGRSYSHTLQTDVSYPFFEGFTLMAAYRRTDARTTYGGTLMERPLTSKNKGLVTASYQTRLGIWQFDVTLQLNGGGRMPTPYTTADGTPSWEARYGAYEQLSAQVTRWFRHWSVYAGGENLTNFKQKNPIVGASDPWGDTFDSTMVWGPVHGAMFYVGVRYMLEKL